MATFDQVRLNYRSYAVIEGDGPQAFVVYARFT